MCYVPWITASGGPYAGIQFKSDQEADGVNVDPDKNDHQGAQRTIEGIVAGEMINIEIKSQGGNDDEERSEHGSCREKTE